MTVKEIFLYKASKEISDGLQPKAIINSTIRSLQTSFNSRHGGVTEHQLNLYTTKLNSWAELSDEEIIKKFQAKIESCKKAEETRKANEQIKRERAMRRSW